MAITTRCLSIEVRGIVAIEVDGKIREMKPATRAVHEAQYELTFQDVADQMAAHVLAEVNREGKP